MRYNPALDGIRALAAFVVLAFHAKAPGFSGGFIGVEEHAVGQLPEQHAGLLFLDWMIALPPESEAYYTEQMDRLKEENAMPYVSMLERVATKRGIEQGIERGIEQGIQTGLREGQLEGRAAMLSRLLQLKFGDLPETLQQRLAQASEAELDLWAERILFADSLEQVID